MSWVTDVLILFSIEESFDENYICLDQIQQIEVLNQWLGEKQLGALINLSVAMSVNGKASQACVYGGSFNYLPIDEFVALVFSLTWREIDSVQVLIKDEEGLKFKLIDKASRT